MSEKPPVFVIAVEVSTSLQRDQIQAFIKQEADSWWHGLADLWLVTGKSAEEWRNLLRVFFPNKGTGSLLVLKLDPGPSVVWSWRSWTFTESQKKWIEENV
jgi:hypothetical protein